MSEIAASRPFSAPVPKESRWHSRFVGIVAVSADFIAIAIGAFLSGLILGGHSAVELSGGVLDLSVYTVSFFLFARSFGLYRQDAKLLELVSTARILQASFYSLLLLSLVAKYTSPQLEVLFLLLSGLLVTASLLLEKHYLRRPLARWKASYAPTRRALIIGANSEARRVFSLFRNSPSLGYDPVAFLDRSAHSDRRVLYGHDYSFREHAEILTGPLTRDLLQELEVHMIFVVDDRLTTEDIAEIETEAEGVGAEISIVFSGTGQRPGKPMNIRTMDGLLIDFGRSFQLDRPGYLFVKRSIDLTGAIFLTIVSAPIWIAIALAVRLTSPGPVLFKQERVGKDGILFPMFKFRSMHADASKYARSPESPEDPRITKVGRFLRRTSLDELPQLLNVLRGEMTLVGPRPEMPYVVQGYDKRVRERLSVQQGVTGIWQLSADRRFAIHETVEYDFYYIRHRGLFLDMAILLHTIAFAMKGI